MDLVLKAHKLPIGHLKFLTWIILVPTSWISKWTRRQCTEISPCLASTSKTAALFRRLVEAGDWEGVVLAAAQFEGQESDIDDTNDQALDDGSEPSLLARGRSDKLESIRREVELLVRRIVPDELGK